MVGSVAKASHPSLEVVFEPGLRNEPTFPMEAVSSIWRAYVTSVNFSIRKVTSKMDEILLRPVGFRGATKASGLQDNFPIVFSLSLKHYP